MTTLPAATPPLPSPNPSEEAIKQRLLRHGVFPTPKILHALRKKHTQKALRRLKKRSLSQTVKENPTSALDEEDALFRRASREYRVLMASGAPWEKLGTSDLKESWDLGDGGAQGRLKGESLEELREVLSERNGEKFRWLLDSDVEKEGLEGLGGDVGRSAVGSWNQREEDHDKIKWLVHRLSSTNVSIQDWKFPRLIKQSGLLFTETILLKVLDQLGSRGNWKQALAVVEWIYKQKDYRYSKSRFVYTKLLAVLGKARRPSEALRVFNAMREDGQIYPDMAAYHSIAVTLGQAGLVKEVTNIIECMREKPSRKLKNMRRKDWDPSLEPDIVIYNAVLNACVPTRQWKGVSWVFKQMRRSGLPPTGATYGLAMEVMLESGKYDAVHKLFQTMQRSGQALKSLTYKVLVRTFWREGKVDEAVAAVRDMEQRGIVGAASVYYELGCCLCFHGRWKEAMAEMVNLRKVPLSKPVEVAFTGMILSSLDGGHVQNCIAIFNFMRDHCSPNIGTINAMLKVYSHADMFAKAKELFETVKAVNSQIRDKHNAASSLSPDVYSYNTMLEVSAAAQQWEYFEHLYKEMIVNGYSLDQRKHVHLLVEASKAGKWHLLEHAFDAILEGGDVPCRSLLTEMLCRTLQRQNYERVIPLVNMMVYASLQVSEKQWTSLFEESQDRISKNKLEKLLELLGNGDIVHEAPVNSLIKSLQYICRSSKFLPQLALPDVLADELGAEDPRMVKQKTGSLKLPTFSVMALNTSNRSSMDYGSCSGSRGDNPLGDFYDAANHAEGSPLTSESLSDSESESSLINDVIESLADDVDPCSLDLPSAPDILESWKQSRIKDGLFPFQL